MISEKEIVELFSYSKDEQEAFPYLARYMKRISKKLPEIENDKAMLKRFALAGLFLTYRADNHGASLMSTEFTYFDEKSRHYKRLKAFKEFFQMEIKSSAHYLKLINMSFKDVILFVLRLKTVSRFLYKFVVKGSIQE